MNRNTLVICITTIMVASTAMVAGATPRAAIDAAKKAATARYSDDKKLCAEENSSGARLQCLRDAKAEYTKALAKAKTAGAVNGSSAAVSASTAAKNMGPSTAKNVAPVCAECGKVTASKIVEKKGESTPLGMIAGGVAGAVLGHQVGGGRGKDIATIAGAAGGAYAGHKIEENVRSTKSWVVSVHFDNGTDQDFSFAVDPGYATGDAVKLSGNSISKR